ncbi:hypothetical protein H4219_003007 [Mycoemilia scoparia]|uniref:Uncharacterized protein n=1 Tax=Mycoemilia scoparia TaxID=417184 RepID=A0A9W8A2G6_9FUNG|nr:hypothetical protein H4219_003007 [Mycoemilia scoparia]
MSDIVASEQQTAETAMAGKVLDQPFKRSSFRKSVADASQLAFLGDNSIRRQYHEKEGLVSSCNIPSIAGSLDRNLEVLGGHRRAVSPTDKNGLPLNVQQGAPQVQLEDTWKQIIHEQIIQHAKNKKSPPTKSPTMFEDKNHSKKDPETTQPENNIQAETPNSISDAADIATIATKQYPISNIQSAAVQKNTTVIESSADSTSHESKNTDQAGDHNTGGGAGINTSLQGIQVTLPDNHQSILINQILSPTNNNSIVSYDTRLTTSTLDQNVSQKENPGINTSSRDIISGHEKIEIQSNSGSTQGSMLLSPIRQSFSQMPSLINSIPKPAVSRVMELRKVFDGGDNDINKRNNSHDHNDNDNTAGGASRMPLVRCQSEPITEDRLVSRQTQQQNIEHNHRCGDTSKQDDGQSQQTIVLNSGVYRVNPTVDRELISGMDGDYQQNGLGLASSSGGKLNRALYEIGQEASTNGDGEGEEDEDSSETIEEEVLSILVRALAIEGLGM